MRSVPPSGNLLVKDAMGSSTSIRLATDQEVALVSEILTEAARWLQESSMPLWREDELEPSRIADELAAELFFVAVCSGTPVGTIKFQLDDPVVWPEAKSGDAAYVHRLAVRRSFAGTGVSTALLRWAVERTRSLGRSYLRLDCEASRPRLKQLYESFGFRRFDDKQVGRYFVTRYEYSVGKYT